jgi:hypothetical protein
VTRGTSTRRQGNAVGEWGEPNWHGFDGVIDIKGRIVNGNWSLTPLAADRAQLGYGALRAIVYIFF